MGLEQHGCRRRCRHLRAASILSCSNSKQRCIERGIVAKLMAGAERMRFVALKLVCMHSDWAAFIRAFSLELRFQTFSFRVPTDRRCCGHKRASETHFPSRRTDLSSHRGRLGRFHLDQDFAVDTLTLKWKVMDFCDLRINWTNSSTHAR